MKTYILDKVNNKLPSFPYFYGVPKLHKQGVPLRPIVATCNSPQSKLSKWLADCLSPLLGKVSNSHLLHSSDFISRVRNLGPTPGKLVSLDVTALFTNVPIEFVIDNLKRVANTNIFEPPIPIEQFCELLKLCVDATIFAFEGQVYKQRFGVAMGSPLSPILANLCLEFIEEYYIKLLPDNIKPVFWVRYVDDIFIIYQHDVEAFNSLLNEINNIVPTIKFTVEEEVNGQLPFLDVMVIHNKQSNSFAFKVYRKPTNAENYIHYYSNHARHVKRNIVTNMFMRALKICDPSYLEEEFNHIRQAFKRLGYPEPFLRECLSKAKQNYYIPRNPISKNKIPRLVLPYSPDLINMQKAIRTSSKHISEQQVDLTFKYTNTIRSRLVKNRYIEEEKSEVGVYCLPCLQCSASYLGETGRGLSTRIEEHKNACKKGLDYSAVANHVLDVGHRVGFSQAQIVYKCLNRNIRRVAEGALISLNDTFHKNTSATKEGKIVNALICQNLKIRNYCNIKATLCSAASPLSPQVTGVSAAPGGTLGTGAYPALPDSNIPPEPPDDHPVPSSFRGGNHTVLRRSQRIQNRNRPTT